MHFIEDLAANLKNHGESVIVFYYSIPMDRARDAFASLGVPFKEVCYRVDLFSFLGTKQVVRGLVPATPVDSALDVLMFITSSRHVSDGHTRCGSAHTPQLRMLWRKHPGLTTDIIISFPMMPCCL